MKKTFSFLSAVCLFYASAFAQKLVSNDRLMVKRFYDEALSNGRAYGLLEQLTTNIGPRLSGSKQANDAVIWAEQTMKGMGFDTVYLQELMVPHWVRGKQESAVLKSRSGKKDLSICALGGSIATPGHGIAGNVIEVKNFDELKQLGESQIKGKIVFFNRPMDPTFYTTFEAYGGAVNQRGRGAIEAAKYGAIGVIVRSMTLSLDDNPHTGAMRYDEKVTKIPAAAISTVGAELLSKTLKEDPLATVTMRMYCQTLPDEKSYNVVGEIRGSDKPDEIITVGGHLDSWDLGRGAHDDGTGCTQSMEAVSLFKTLGIRPKRTLRAVMFMNEENGLRGGSKYAELAAARKEKLLAAIESDAGGFAPRGFSIDTSSAQTLDKISSWSPFFEPYGVVEFAKGGAGADIYTLKNLHALTMELHPESQRYFDYHHARTDTFDKVNKRELELGAATLAAMMYLLSEHGLE